MKAIIFFNNSTDQEVHGKDLRITRDAPGEYHITDAYHNHRLLAAYGNVQYISLVGKPKERKPKVVETLQVKIDTSELRVSIKEAMLELEGLADKEQFIHKEDIDDDYLDRNISAEALALYGVTAARAERDQLQKEVGELRDQIQQLAFVPPDVATAAKLLDAELLVFLDQAKKYPGPDANQDIHFSNGLRFAIGKLTGDPVPFAQVPFNPPAKPAPAPAPAFQTTAIIDELENKLADGLKTPLPIPRPMPDVPHAYRDAPTAETLLESKSGEVALDFKSGEIQIRPPQCTCPAKRNIIDRGHMGSCPQAQPQKQPDAGESDTPTKE